MAALRKFMFDRTFEPPPTPGRMAAAAIEAPAAAIEPEAPPPPTYSEEDLAQARDEAYAQGREAGLKEMSETLERETRDTLAAVDAALREVMWSHAAIETRASEDAVHIALAAIRRLFPALAERDPLAEIEGVVRQALALVQGEENLNIYINDSLLEPAIARIKSLAAAGGFQDRIQVQSLPSLAPGDCRIEWGGGGIGRDAAAIMKAVEDAVRRALPDQAPAREPAAPPAAPEPATPPVAP